MPGDGRNAVPSERQLYNPRRVPVQASSPPSRGRRDDPAAVPADAQEDKARLEVKPLERDLLCFKGVIPDE